jgi:hypothetical protein
MLQQAWRNAPASSLQPAGSPALLKVSGKGTALSLDYRAERSYRDHRTPDLFALGWRLPAAGIQLPAWVDERSSPSDRPQDVLPRGSQQARTLNLALILHTAQRNIGEQQVATAYLEVGRP